MDHNLLCPMQLRMNEVMIDDCPKFLHLHLTDETHAIKVPGADSEDDYLIPLSLQGVTSFFPTRKPTMREWENCRQIELTSESPEWDPHDSMYADQEDALLDKSGRLRDFGDRINRNESAFPQFL
eukprot:scaffold264194_cov49-Attheya_sp.AAC.2